MRNKTVFVSAEGLVIGILLLLIWPWIQSIAPARLHQVGYVLSLCCALVFLVINTTAADGAENSRAIQWGNLITSLLYGVANIGAYNPLAVVSVGMIGWGALTALRSKEVIMPFEMQNQWRVLVTGGIGILVGMLVAIGLFPYLTIKPNLWFHTLTVIGFIIQHFALVAYLVGGVKGNSWVFRYAKGVGAILALVQNLAYNAPGSVAYQSAMLTVMLLLTAHDRFRKNQNPPSSS